MKTKRKRSLPVIVLGALILLPLIAVAVTLLFVDADVFKPRVAAAASDALNMDVRIDGSLGVRLRPVPQLRLDAVHVSQHGSEWFSAETVYLQPAVLPLLRGELRVISIDLMAPRLQLARDNDNRFNPLPRESRDGDSNMALKHIRFRRATVSYADPDVEGELVATDCDFSTDDLSWKEDGEARVAFSGELRCARAAGAGLTMEDMQTTLSVADGAVAASHFAATLFGGQAGGSLETDFTADPPAHEVLFSLDEFHIDRFMEAVGMEPVATGTMDFDTRLMFRGRGAAEMMSSLAGHARLRGWTITLHGRDLDELLAQVDSARQFNFVDVGALFFAGPAGLLVTRGYEVAGLVDGSGNGETAVRRLVSDWRIDDGIATAQDVALATEKNRIAVRGGLNLVEARYHDLRAAVIDRDGCAVLEQEVRGSFSEPEIEQPHLLEALVAPLVDLLEEGMSRLAGRECEVFYAGEVSPPE